MGGKASKEEGKVGVVNQEGSSLDPDSLLNGGLNLDGFKSEEPGTLGAMFKVLSFMIKLDCVVGDFVGRIEREMLNDNMDILEDFYNASRAMKELASKIRESVGDSLEQLSRMSMLQAELQSQNDKERDPQKLVLLVNSIQAKKLNLPYTLLGDITAVKDLYDKLLMSCMAKKAKFANDREKEADRYMWITGGIIVGCLALTAMGVAFPIIAAHSLAKPLLITSLIGAIGTSGAALTVLGLATGALSDCRTLLERLKEEVTLLETAKAIAFGLSQELWDMQDRIEKLQVALKRLTDKVDAAQFTKVVSEFAGLQLKDKLEDVKADLTALDNVAQELSERSSMQSIRKQLGKNWEALYPYLGKEGWKQL